MKFTSSLLTNSTAILFAVAAAQGAQVDPITTITPCPEAKDSIFPPITVTSQYQDVYTCQPRSLCIKQRCSTIFDLKAYPYVSTVIPCAWDGTTASTTTITRLDQPVRVSEHVETLTKTITATVFPSETGGQWEVWEDWHTAHMWSKEAPKPTVTTTSLYETVTRRAVAPYEDIGPLAVPGWNGSELCEECVNSKDGSRSQLLDVIECRFGVDRAGEPFHTCSEWAETWVERYLPTSTALAEAVCVSQGSVPAAGTYTWTFPQSGQPVAVTAPPTTMTTTLSVSQQETVIVEPEIVYTLPGKPWNAYVTRTFPAPTNFAFNVFVTTTVTVSVPYITRPAEK
ncbi:uncharacterized protein PV06_10815 [Exophiala oligosperma]|uniref:Ig-like domain-containing protein n=2 Tax=Chaetothyriales TaxID=34395 RepID=A0A0D2A9A3_9EURO|nr:uncharacterized protein PV06_10815 [Exophiala oligosperma]KAJ9639714.1 hypothetical protein H2204_003507 [Knufia peltigerae]KIW36911.1 hypothetical protein PV06_10815 [Exophiala oligosperma]